MPEPASDPAFERHDHARCAAAALEAAARTCDAQGLRLTEIRARVLGILCESHAAMGAYDVLDRLREDGRRAQPPVAYRALDFLVAHGFAHRIERLNAYVACGHPGDDHAPAFMICRGCRRVAECAAPAAAAALAPQAEAMGFRIERTVVEAEGVCPDCRAEATDGENGAGGGSEDGADA
ncbi:MAG: transcriptional repressor [Pseudomonadota bacterium]|nr:transcriptional repressor [Pseudomonadota bacterium]